MPYPKLQSCEKRTVHFSLSHMPDASAPYTLHMCGQRYPLQQHTAATRAAAAASNRAIAVVPPEQVTHFAENVEHPTQSVTIMWVSCPAPEIGPGATHLALSSIVLPKDWITQSQKAKTIGVTLAEPKLSALGVSAADQQNPQVALDAEDFKTPTDAAISLIFHHPEVTSFNQEAAPLILQHIKQANGLQTLAIQIGNQGSDWCTPVPVMNPYVTPSVQMTGSNGQPGYSQDPSQTTLNFLPTPLGSTLNLIKNDLALQNLNWSVQDGNPTVNAPAASPQAKPRAAALAETPAPSGITPALRGAQPDHGLIYDLGDFTESGGASTLNVSLTNYYLRYLSAYVQFLDIDENPITPPNWTSLLPDYLPSDCEDDTHKYLGLVDARPHFMFAPLVPEATELPIAWPTNTDGTLAASYARVLAGGLGLTNPYPGDIISVWDGLVWTSIVNLGVPAIMLAFAVGEQPGFEEEFIEALNNPGFKQALKVAIPFLKDGVEIGFSAADGDIQGVVKSLADMIVGIISGSPAIIALISASITEEEVVDEVPFLGWALRALEVLSTLANLVETVVEILMSPKVYENTVALTLSANVTVNKDPDDPLGFPQAATQYKMIASMSEATSFTLTNALTQTAVPSMNILMPNLPVGGTVQFTICFYDDDDNLLGKGQSNSLPNQIPSGQSELTTQITIQEYLAPLSANTQYQQSRKLVFENGERTWSQTAPVPTATVTSLSSSQVGNNLTQLNGITCTEGSSELLLGYSWKASGLNIPQVGTTNPVQDPMFVMQNLSAVNPSDNTCLMVTPEGFPQAPKIAYQLSMPSSGTPNMFWIDPRDGANPVAQYHVRRMVLSGGSNFDLSTGQSWGYFTENLNSVAVHPNGYLIGVNQQNCKMEILKLPAAAVPDDQAPCALVCSGIGQRQGLLSGPALVTIAPDGTVLVLETGASRIQAFDLNGNPCKLFSGGTTYFAPLQAETGIVYTDLACDVKGYMFVLSFSGNGETAAQYRLDIYQPNGAFLCRTTNIPAANMTVDLFRNVFTLNYELLAKPAAQGTEPSLGQWVPETK